MESPALGVWPGLWRCCQGDLPVLYVVYMNFHTSSMREREMPPPSSLTFKVTSS